MILHVHAHILLQKLNTYGRGGNNLCKKQFLMLNLRLNKNIFIYLVDVLCLLPPHLLFEKQAHRHLSSKEVSPVFKRGLSL